MSTDSNISWQETPSCVRLTLARAEKLNPLDWVTVRELKDAVAKIEGMPGVVAVVIGLIWWNARSLFRADASRRHADLALREAEAVYHSLVETLPQRIFRKDLAGRYTFGNGNFCVLQ